MKTKRWNTDRKTTQNSGGGEFYHLEALLVASNLRAIQDNTVVGGIN